MTDDHEIRYAYDTETTENEERRLRGQSDSWRVGTEAWLRNAGIGPGMRVLEVGCGVGALSFILADLMGPAASVVAFDRDENMIAAARAAALEADRRIIEFVHADIASFDPNGVVFDAAVGRLVLMYQPDPVEAVRSVARHVRSGGTVTFFESCLAPRGVRAPGHEWRLEPATSISETISSWIPNAVMSLGTQPYMGLRLPSVLADAGLVPDMRISAMANVSPPPSPDLAAAQIRGVLPMILANGIATEAEVDIETLADRLAAERASNPFALLESATLVGVHAIKP